MTAAPVVSTYSMWSLFRNCRKAVDWRYQQRLVPLQRDRNLHFGSLIHECLQVWHQRRDLDEVLALIDRLCPNHLQDDNQRRDWHLAIAMMKAYAAQYAAEDFEVIALEKNFEGPIVNPATGAASRSFVLAGKVDGIVRIGGEHFILEHKTAAQIDSDYLEKLWTDFQITIYAHYVEQTMGIPITGILYNVLVKAKLQQSKGETEEEFQDRRAELLAKSKTGKSSAKRRHARDRRRVPDAPRREVRRTRRCSIARCCTCPATVLTSSAPNCGNSRRPSWTPAAAASSTRTPHSASTTSGLAPTLPSAAPTAIPNLIENFYQRVAPNEELRVLPADAPEPAF